MHKVLRVFGWLGVAWSVFVGVLGLLAMLGSGGPLDPLFFLLVSALLIASVRLVQLRRWSAVALSGYSVWMIADSFRSGLPLWSVAWVMISTMLIALTQSAWRYTLRPGF